MLQLPCLRLGLKSGNDNIVQLKKSLCSASYPRDQSALCRLIFTFRSAVCRPNQKSSVKYAYLHCKTLVNPKAYRRKP